MHLHIVAFNVPWPADYGGVIDVYHRIAALADNGVRIHLHCYTYGREAAKELETLCEEVRYYPRETGLRHQLERRPYIVASRNSKALIERLREDVYPIMLEGLHCCDVLEKLKGQGRKITVRAHNVEHDYYNALAKAETCGWKKLFFKLEAAKLRKYEGILKQASSVLAISEADAAHFRANGCANVTVLPPSHGHHRVTSQPGWGDYVLYHGNLSVPENIHAAKYILEKIAPQCPYRFVIAGRDPDESIREMASHCSNAQLIENPSVEEMDRLLGNAQVNLLITQQATGVKLKLMNALYEGRHCLVNSTMVMGTQLGEACAVADSQDEICNSLAQLMQTEFTEAEIQKRVAILKRADSLNDFRNIIL